MKNLLLTMFMTGLVTFSPIISSCSDTIQDQKFDRLLQGKWHSIKRERYDGIQTNARGLKFKPNYDWEFNNGKLIDHIDNNYTHEGIYSIKDSNLIIGNDRFKIEKITSRELIIVQFDPHLGYATSGDMRDFFEKVKEFNFKQ